jgi:hypothetical protein
MIQQPLQHTDQQEEEVQQYSKALHTQQEGEVQEQVRCYQDQAQTDTEQVQEQTQTDMEQVQGDMEQVQTDTEQVQEQAQTDMELGQRQAILLGLRRRLPFNGPLQLVQDLTLDVIENAESPVRELREQWQHQRAELLTIGTTMGIAWPAPVAPVAPADILGRWVSQSQHSSSEVNLDCI